MNETPDLVRRRRWRLVLAALLLAALVPLAAHQSAVSTPPIVEAAIANNPPGQSFGSLLDCLQPGAMGLYATTCFGSKWSPGPYGSGSDDYDAPTTDAAVVTFYDAKPDQANSNPGEDSTHLYPAALGEVGSVYGLAYRSQSRTLFTSAYTKRITRFGIGGPAAIYRLDPLDSGLAQPIITVPGADAGVPTNGSRQYHDQGVTDIVGKGGLGDLAISPDETRLLVVDLAQRAVHQFQATAPYALLSSVPLPLATAGCPAGVGDMRPFGITERRVGGQSQIVVAFVCSGQTRSQWADVRVGALMSTDGGASWGRVAFTTIDQRHNDPRVGASSPERWTYWRPDASAQGCQTEYRCPQPMAASIDFLYDGRLVIGLRDRYADMAMAFNDKGGDIGIAAGDVIVLAPTGPTSWGNVVLASDGNEYLKDDNTHPTTVAYEHLLGAVAVVPGLHSGGVGQEIVTTSSDGYRDFTGHIAWFDYPLGPPAQVNRSGNEEIYVANTANFGKAAGLGDLVPLCAWAQIGDRVWIDSNGNGVQDGGEPSQSGVVLRVTQGSRSLDLTTDGNGFWSAFLDPFQPATVQVVGGVPSGYGFTLANAGGNDATDSDADGSGRISVPALGYHNALDLSFDIGLTNGVNVRVSKSAPATTVRGSALSFSLAYANDGPGAAQGVTVVDTLPAGLTFVSASPAPSSVSGQTLTWNLGTLPAGASGTITVNTTVRADAPTTLTNSATISTSTRGDNPGDNTSTTTTTVLAPNVYVQKDAQRTVVMGASLVYTIGYGNNGQAPAAGVVLVDTLPNGVSYVSASPPPSSVSGQTLTWNLGTLAAGSSGLITINTTVNGSAPTTVSNSATISTTTPGDPPGDNTSTTTTTVLRPNVTVQKSGPTAATVGDAFGYTLAYSNNGSAPADSTTLVDMLPAGISYISASPAPASVSGQTLTWNLGTLAAGASGTISVQVQSSPTLTNGTVVVNSVAISTSSPGDNPNDNSSTASTTLYRADVAISKSSPTSFPVVSGGTVVYYLDYINNGPATAVNVTLQDSVPRQVNNVSWSCTSGCSASGSGNAISLSLGSLPAGANGRITVSGRATTSVAREDFTNTGTISTTTPETRTDNNQSTVPGAVWTSDLQVVKLAAPQAIAGTTFTATLTYRNAGPAPAAAVTLVDTLPPGITFVSATRGGATFSPTVSGQTLSWALGDLPDQGGDTVSLLLRADPTIAEGTTVVNQTLVGDGPGASVPTSDRDGSNNTSSAPTLILTRADVQVSKGGPARVPAGDGVTFTITYTNTGPSVARGVILTDTLPSELDFVAATPEPSSASGALLTWSVGDLAVGAGGSITVQMNSRFDQLAATLPVTNSIVVESRTSDPTPENNRDEHLVQVETVDLQVIKTMPPVIVAGRPFTATLDWRNNGPATARATTLRDLLPTNAPPLQLISATPAPSGPGLRWNLGDVAAGDGGRVTLVLRAPTAALSGTTYLNTAVIDTTRDRDRDPSNDIDDAQSVVRPLVNLVIEKDGPLGPLASGSVVSYTLRYRNDGPSLAVGVQVRDTLPVSFTFQRATPAPTVQNGTTLTWALDDLPAGASGSITVVGTLLGDGVRVTRTNVAIITSRTDEEQPGDNSDQVQTVVEQPDLDVQKSDGVTSAQPGDLLVYTIIVRNSGPMTATGVVLTELPPAGVRVVASEWSAGPGGEWSLLVGTLAPGASARRSFAIELPTPYREPLVVNTVQVDDGAPGADPTPEDTTSTDTDTVLAGRVGDWVWIDEDRDGVQDAGEQGAPFVPIELRDPSDGALLATVETDMQGRYEFAGLRLGSYSVQIAPAALLQPPLNQYLLTTPAAPATLLDPLKREDLTLDIGLGPQETTAVLLRYLRAERQGEGVLVRWGTVWERETARFRLLRATTRDRAAALEVGSTTSKGSNGGDYQLRDATAPLDGPLFYWLVEVERDGDETFYGPITFAPGQTAAPLGVYLPVVRR